MFTGLSPSAIAATSRYQGATSLLQAKGTLGLIATNTVAQGDTREVGLDTMDGNGFTITRAIQSRSWPSSGANLEYAAVWGTLADIGDDVLRVADNVPVRTISTLLEAQGRATGLPIRLIENAGVAFLGAKVYGMGFVLDPAEAQEWIAADARNAEVLFPFLNGEDLNSRPDCSPSRWVIDFNDRSETESAAFELPFARALERVRPERMKNNRAVRRERWWQYGENAPGLRRAVAELSEAFVITRVSKTVMPVRVPADQVFSDSLIAFASDDHSDQAQVLAIALVSKTVMPVRVPAAQVFSHALGIFVTDRYCDQAVLSSTLHQLWAITYGSTLETRIRYTPSDVFETFPLPPRTERLYAVGNILDLERREIMLGRNLGLTNLYNLVNDSGVKNDPEVSRVREIHVEIDEALLAAYGWDDINLDHGFHAYRQVERWGPCAEARTEILDRLLAENHARAAAAGSRLQVRPAASHAEETLFD